MSNKLIIHAGMPKTGTTALQNYLYQNNAELQKQGYCYPDLLRDMNRSGYRIDVRDEAKSKNGVIFSLFRKQLKKEELPWLFGESWSTFAGILQSYLEQFHVILSDEDLWSQNNRRLILEHLKEICDDMEIVVYLRRQDLIVEAVWNQIVKRYGYCTIPFQEAREQWEKDNVLAYLKNLDMYRAIVGAEHLKVRVYEKAQLNDEDVRVDFVNLFDIEMQGVDFEKGALKNERLTGSLLNIKRAMNRELSKADWFSGLIEEYFLEATANMSRREQEAYYTLQERRTFLERFEDENREIAKKYLGRMDGKLFLEEMKERSVHSEEMSLSDVVSVFTHIALEQEKKLYRLSVNQWNLKYIARGRKITAFGAADKCRQFLSVFPGKIDAIVDNDPQCVNKKFGDYVVTSPTEISDWKERFIVVTSGAYLEIKRQLEMLDLVEDEDFVPIWRIMNIL